MSLHRYPPHRAGICPFEIAESKCESFPDGRRKFVFRYRDKSQRRIKFYQFKCRMHVEWFAATRGNEYLDCPACIPMVPERFERKDAVHFKAVGVAPAPRSTDKRIFKVYGENPVVFPIRFLVVVMYPEFLGTRKLFSR